MMWITVDIIQCWFKLYRYTSIWLTWLFSSERHSWPRVRNMMCFRRKLGFLAMHIQPYIFCGMLITFLCWLRIIILSNLNKWASVFWSTLSLVILGIGKCALFCDHVLCIYFSIMNVSRFKVYIIKINTNLSEDVAKGDIAALTSDTIVADDDSSQSDNEGFVVKI